MADNTNLGLCPSCESSIFCPTWDEWKCKVHERRIYGYKTMTECKFYKKRGKDCKESPCQCEDCLREAVTKEE